MRKKISLEQWCKLSDEQKTLLKKLGFKAPGVKTSPLPAPYILAVHTVCGLCEREEVSYWRMQPSYFENVPFNKGERIKCHTGAVIADRIQRYWQPTCRKCSRNLRRQDKAVLIRKLIHYALRAAIRTEMEEK